MEVIPLVNGEVPYDFVVVSDTPLKVTTTLGDAIDSAGAEGTINISYRQLWAFVQFEGEGKPTGPPLRFIPEKTTPEILMFQLNIVLQNRSMLLYEFYIGDCKLEGTLASVCGDDTRDDTPIVVTYKRDLAFKRHLEAAWPAWEGCGVVPEAESAAKLAEGVAVRAEIARMLAAMTEVGTPPELTPLSTPDQKAAYFLYAGMSALDYSKGNSFELTKQMLLQGNGDIKPSILTCIINDLARRENAPLVVTPTNRTRTGSGKAKRDENAILCSSSQHRFVLATCLHDAFMAFVLDTDEAKANRTVFKPARAGSSADA